MNDKKYSKTLNRRYNELVECNIITDSYNTIVEEYIQENEIHDVIIDSMDILNGNCNKNDIARSYKLHKQAVRLSIICDNEKMPLIYRTDPAHQPDNVLGFELAKKFTLPDNNTHILAADKGYNMNDEKKKILKLNNLILVAHKKRYRRKKIYKTKNYKRKIKKVRHSQQMKQSLKNRIVVEHSNNLLHRSFKRLMIVYDKSLKTFNRFVELAIICMIFHHNKNHTKHTI